MHFESQIKRISYRKILETILMFDIVSQEIARKAGIQHVAMRLPAGVIVGDPQRLFSHALWHFEKAKSYLPAEEDELPSMEAVVHILCHFAHAEGMMIALGAYPAGTAE